MLSKVGSLFFLIVGLAGAALVIAGMGSYSGSKLMYFLFCLSFWLMLLMAVDRRTHYGYLFLVVILWLGFWGKITAHLILDYPYMEPVGQFDGSAEAWDQVLCVAIVASIGVMLGRLVFRTFSNAYSREMRCDQSMAPAWYPAVRKWVWLFAVTGMVGVAIANMLLGIQQIGLAPRMILPWPLNALIAWQVSIGSALLLTVLLWWEVALRKNIAVSIYAPLLEAGLATSSLLSRGIYVFHTLPQLFAFFENRKYLIGLTKIKLLILMVSFGCLMMLTIAGVTTFRTYLYPHLGGFTTEAQKRLTQLEVLEGGIAHVRKLIAKGEPQEGHLLDLLAEKARLEKALQNQSIPQHPTSVGREAPVQNVPPLRATEEIPGQTASDAAADKPQLYDKLINQIGSAAVYKILSLSVDRWIGLEGVMAVVAYSDKGMSLLKEAALEKREAGNATKFQIVANSHYRWTDANQWRFASLPGSAAFLFFSGSMWVVLLGMALFVIVLQIAEQLVFKLTANPLLCSLFGFTLANNIAQFGVAPRQDIPFYTMIACFVLFVCVVQSDKTYKFIRKHVGVRNDRGTA